MVGIYCVDIKTKQQDSHKTLYTVVTLKFIRKNNLYDIVTTVVRLYGIKCLIIFIGLVLSYFLIITEQFVIQTTRDNNSLLYTLQLFIFVSHQVIWTCRLSATGYKTFFPNWSSARWQRKNSLCLCHLPADELREAGVVNCLYHNT